MRRFNHTDFAGKLLGLPTAFLLLTLAACGGMNSQNRVLMSMTLSPATADAQSFANGQVQFTATGVFSEPASPATMTFMEPFSGSWMVSNSNIATIDQNGMAQCVQGTAGVVTITAIASSNSAGMSPGAMSTAVSATAMLTCP